MVGRMIVHANSRKTGIGAALWLCSGVAFSQLNDPTRPPAGFVDEVGPVGAAAAAATAASEIKADQGAAAGPFTLQSVVLSKQGRSVAIIGGHYVPLGAKHAGYELQSVTQDSATLVRGKDKKVLKLTPLVEKREPGSRPERDASRRPAVAKQKKPGSPS